MKTMFEKSGFQAPGRDYFGPKGGHRKMGDFWSDITGAIPTVIDKGTDIYLKEQDQKIAKEKAEQAQAAAQAAATVKAAADKAASLDKIAGIDRSTFIIGAVGLGLAAIIVTIAVAK